MGNVAAMRAQSALDSSLTSFPSKLYFATAAAPYIPSPISIELRYTSIILCLDQNISMRNVKYISKPLRTQLRPGHKKTFLAVCWEIVEAP